MEEDVESGGPEKKGDGEAVVPEKNVCKTQGEEVEAEDEDEDEDFDFDPLLQNIDEKEASSSLSSEENEEGLDEEGKDHLEGGLYDENETPWIELGSDVEEDELVGNYEEDDEEDVDDDENTEDNNDEVPGDQPSENRQEGETMLEGMESIRSALDVSCDALTSCNASGQDEDMGNLTDKAEAELLGQTMNALPDLNCPRKSVIVSQHGERNDEDIEDAIWKRTRARYSLADMSLDELETFLQESDEEDFFQNVDDEEEYRKFLAAVAGSLEGNNKDDQVLQSKEDEDDEDEDNDADFEIEIEEALESDDEIIDSKSRKRKHWENRPTTRERRRQKTFDHAKDRLLGLAKTPLRPLLPLTESLQTQCQSLEGKSVMPDQFLHDGIHIEKKNAVTGFTAHQIGQLHCLIHEHVQLLVQVFSICVLEPSKQQIATEAKRMLNELVDKCDEVLTWKKNSFPDFCFHPPYIHLSVSENIQLHPMPMLSDIHNRATTSTATGDTLRNDMESGWVPAVSGPVRSVLEVAPLGLVREFLHDVDLAVQESMHRIGEFHIQDEREPLFLLPGTDPCSQGQQKMRGAVSSGTNVVSSTHPQQKKTMAAVLVENTKRQSVALVLKNIVKVVQRFYPLFNAALFPHKPPPASTANRLLFTDSEDELLAMGLMTYNTNWKAIKERFLPCKSVHQIFVRQKNRASSRAPENSIKAVRRMKTSPLTTEEKICIHEGLRVLKYDWRKVWEYCVPYRDPNLLPRQWRIALGTQRSYKTDEKTKEKRRVYEANRRRSKALQRDGSASVGIEGEHGQQFENDDGEENSGDDNTDDIDEAYVHEAFLAEKPSVSRFMAAIPSPSSALGMNRNSFVLANLGSQGGGGYNERMGSVQVHSFNSSSSGIQSLHQNVGCQVSQASYTSQMPSTITASLQSTSQPFLDYSRRPVRTPVNLRPYRSRNKHRAQTVKLAPGLPPLNLPPSVRVIPQSMLMARQCGGSQRMVLAPNKKSNPLSCTSIIADPQCSLQISKDSIDSRVVQPGSSTVVSNTSVSTPIVGLERNLSSEPNLHFTYNHEKEVRSVQQISSSAPNQDSAASHETEETPQMEEPKPTRANHETNETDIHMHPLLLQNPCEDSIRYEYNKYAPRTQIPFSALQGSAHNSDFHSFFMPYQQNGMLNHQSVYPPASLNKGAMLSSNAADFHPLLQKNIETTEVSSTVTNNPTLQQSCNSGRSGIPLRQVSPAIGISRPLACHTETQEVNHLQQRERPIPYSAPDANEMQSRKHSDTRNDMTTIIEEGSGSKVPEITQGCNSRALKRKETVGNKKQITGQAVIKESVSSLRRRKNGKCTHVQGCQASLNKSASYFHGVESVIENDPAAYMDLNNIRSSDNTVISRQLNKENQETSMTCLKDDSLLDIVMEREELSDSEDDIGESVQFEYEEMGDSDGDYTALAHQSNMSDKEDHSIEFEKEEIVSDGDEIDEVCKIGDTVSSRTPGASEDTLSVSAVASLSTRQSLVRNRSKKPQCCNAAADSMDMKSKKKKQSCKQGVDKHHVENVQNPRRRNRRVENSQENSNIHTRNLPAVNSQEFELNTANLPPKLSTPSPVRRLQKGKKGKQTEQTALSLDSGVHGCTSAFEKGVVPKMHANGPGFHSEVSTQGSESHVSDKENSTCQRIRDKTAIEAAQVLTGIHQSTPDKKNGPQVS